MIRKRPSLRAAFLAGGIALVTSAVVVAQDAPESLLPPGFDNPAPAPTPTPRASATRAPAQSAPSAPNSTSVPVIQPLPAARPGAPAAPPDAITADRLDSALLDQLLEAQRPKTDIPPGQARSLATVGVLAEGEGGLRQADTGVLNGTYVASVIGKTSGSIVSRWGEILLRRALASRLDTPVGMNGADWAALRAGLLLRMGEGNAARALVQQVDSGNYTPALEDAALNSYIATGDILGACPITAITAARRSEGAWLMAKSICRSFNGEGTAALAELERYRRRGIGREYKNIDILLAQKYAGAALEGKKAVNIEWTGVEDMTPWRYGMTLATGLEPPKDLMAKTGDTYSPVTATAPMVPLETRADAADRVASRGILSSTAMVDLWSQIYSDEDVGDEWKGRAAVLREAYVAAVGKDRVAAMKELWGGNDDAVHVYSRHVLTAYAAARLRPDALYADDAGDIVASMLSAGLDANAVRWAKVVPIGSQAWALLTLAAPQVSAPISTSSLDDFKDDDGSEDARKSKFLIAGLAGLDRVTPATANDFGASVAAGLGRQTRWTQAIDAAAKSGNQPLVAFLAGAGMQGDSWALMTPLHLYHIVSALRRVGLEGEARMIAAEAVARG